MIHFSIPAAGLMLFTISLPAQNTMKLQAGAIIKTTGGVVITLQDMNLDNDGSINQQPGEGKFIFTGVANNTIAGSSNPLFDILEISKTGVAKLSLLQNINIGSSINFSSGLIDLNNNNILLQPAALLVAESENSRITGTTGGYIEITRAFNPAIPNNFGNMGAVLTSSQNLGSTRIRRGHKSQTNGTGQGNSILRYFDITPSNNTGLNATLRFQYFDAELYIPLNENSLVLWKSINNSNWTNEGFTSNNVVVNYVEKTGISDFSRWTLSGNNNALPVQFILFNSKCEGNRIVINWKTAQEQNSSHFNIERSTDGINWTVIGDLPAAGNSNTERSYSFNDNSPVQNNYYRIAQFDIDGRVGYTSILKASCNANEVFNVWPNPFYEMVFVNISVAIRSEAVIKIYDNKGALIKIERTTLFQGNNQLSIDLKNLASAAYQLVVEWNNGQIKKTKQIIKQ